MIHLWTTAGTGLYPVCGVPNARKGETTYSALYSDLCKGCIAYQARKSYLITRRLRIEKRNREENGEA